MIDPTELARITKIDQTTFGNGEDPNDEREPGNCFEACVATVLGIPLDATPTYGRSLSWWIELEEWLATKGLWPLMLDTEKEPFTPHGVCIANGFSHRGVRHSVVVVDGDLFHDPHPSRGGLDKTYGYVLFVPLNAATLLDAAERLGEAEEALRPYEDEQFDNCAAEDAGYFLKPLGAKADGLRDWIDRQIDANAKARDLLRKRREEEGSDA